MLLTETIESEYVLRGENVNIGKNSIIKATEVVLGNNVTIGDHVEIICDKVILGNDCKIGDGTTIICPEIDLSDGCAIGKAVQCELNEYFRLGKYSAVGNRVTIAGQGVSSGAFLWLKNDVIIGGGGSQGPNSYLNMGERVAVMDKAFINLSEEVSIGDESALSYNVIILTHGAAQPLLMGYTTKYAPVKIGKNCAIYINSVVLPGVSIGDYATIAASSLVNKDIAAHALASGNPARIIVKGKDNYPRSLGEPEIDKLMADILTDYAETLQPKGLIVVSVVKGNPFTITVELEGKIRTISYFAGKVETVSNEKPQDISLSHINLPATVAGKVHFNLHELAIEGETDSLAEDLRDYLRRRAIRIYTDKPFRTIPLTNLHRLKQKRKTSNQK